MSQVWIHVLATNKGALDKNVCEYKLWTRLAVMKRKKATGFVGWVTYE